MLLNDLYECQIITPESDIVRILKSKLSEWAASIPHHPYREAFSERILIFEVSHKPIYLYYLEVQYEIRDIAFKREPNTGSQEPGSIPDMTYPKLLKLNKEVEPFTNASFIHRFNGNELPCNSCHQLGYHVCVPCNGRGQITCMVCNGKGEKTCSVCHGNGNTICNQCDSYGMVRGICWSCGGGGKKYTTTRCSTCGGRGVYGNNTVCMTCSMSGFIPTTLTCNFCSGRGSIDSQCGKCKGSKIIRCNNCSGQGIVTCKKCYGKGVLLCTQCSGNGKITCSICDGWCTLLEYAEVSQKFSHQRSKERLYNAHIHNHFSEIQIKQTDSQLNLPVFSEEAKTLPDLLSTGNLHINADYQQLHSIVKNKINKNVDVIKEKFQVWQIDTYQMNCRFENTEFDVWFYGKLFDVYDGGSPVKIFQIELIDKAKSFYSQRKFYDSYNTYRKSVDMDSDNVPPEKSETLKKIRNRLLLAMILGSIFASIVNLFLVPMYIPILYRCWFEGSILKDFTGYLTLIKISSLFLIILNSMLPYFVGHFSQLKAVETKIRSDYKRFLIGFLATITLNFFVCIIILLLTTVFARS